eukprot:7803652-Pyramimonas_sp.AAC.1
MKLSTHAAAPSGRPGPSGRGASRSLARTSARWPTRASPSSVTSWQKCSAQLQPIGNAASAASTGTQSVEALQPRKPTAPPRSAEGVADATATEPDDVALQRFQLREGGGRGQVRRQRR